MIRAAMRSATTRWISVVGLVGLDDMHRLLAGMYRIVRPAVVH